MADEVAVAKCPECGNPRPDLSTTCPTCGAPPIRGDEHRAQEEEVRTDDLEPYVTLRYIARLFKIFAVLMVIMLVFDAITSIMTGTVDIAQMIARATYMLVLAGVMWAGGDITVLLIDMGHDLRVARILLGRVNAQLHKRQDLKS